jgi:hypothetical protein
LLVLSPPCCPHCVPPLVVVSENSPQLACCMSHYSSVCTMLGSTRMI